MADVHLFNTPDGGDVTVHEGDLELSPGLETMAYLCLFGGNVEDSSLENDPLSWWGNIDEAVQYRSRTQFLLAGLPVTSGNLQQLQRAAEFDLNTFVTEGVATSVAVEVTLANRNHVRFECRIDNETLLFEEVWASEFRNANH